VNLTILEDGLFNAAATVHGHEAVSLAISAIEVVGLGHIVNGIVVERVGLLLIGGNVLNTFSPGVKGSGP